MKISFDYDETLSEDYVQAIAFALVVYGHDVFIISTRPVKSTNKDVWQTAKDLNIKQENVHFTDSSMKAETIKKLGIQLHFDDMEDEVGDIKANTNCKTMLVNFNMNGLIASLKQELHNEKKAEDKLH